jgi:hypothetical protein
VLKHLSVIEEFAVYAMGATASPEEVRAAVGCVRAASLVHHLDSLLVKKS